MLYTIEIIPNIWWIYTDKFKTFNQEEFNYINKFTNYHKITSLVKLDDYCSFWNKSSKFIIDIKKQLELHEISSFKKLILLLNSKIYGNYLENKPTLIISNEYNELGYLYWLYFFKSFIDIPIEQIIESFNMKLIVPIPISEKERRFISLTKDIK